MATAPAMPLILASASTVRAKLLRAAGCRFEVEAANVDESEIKQAVKSDNGSVEDAARLLAELKARRVSQRRVEHDVIGADQILECDGRWFDKPAGLDQARAQLIALRGRTHRLISAVAVARNGSVLWHHVDAVSLTMRRFSDRFLDDYLAQAGDDVCASVGAYRLEGLGVQLFARIHGDYFSVLGLPLLALLDFLRGREVVAE